MICVAWHLQSTGQTYHLWRDELTGSPPYPIDDETLFVCFVGSAELTCHLSLDWPLPKHVLDLNPVFRFITSGRTVLAGRGLLGALAYFHLPTGDSKRKEVMQDRCAQGWPFTDEEKAAILKYCASDVDGMVPLLPKMLPYSDFDTALFWGEFVSASAQMEHHGVPIDVEIHSQLSNKHTWRAIRDEVTPIINANFNVYVRDKSGDWKFDMELFRQYLEREGIAWPITDKGTLKTSQKTFDNMTKGHPQLEPLRQLRYMRSKMRKIKLAVGSDARNRTVLWPFQSKTSRTQPKASKWIFSPAVWLRSLIKPTDGSALAYIDWSSMEFMIAACLSGDPVMIDFYLSGDPYLSFAKRVGAAPQWATKKTHGELRDRYKVGLLAIQYGMGPETLAARLGISLIAAQEMLAQHRELFPVYWAWSKDWTNYALNSGLMQTVIGWQCATGITEFNARSIANWPVQSTGADILRIAVVWGTRRGLKLCAPVHDAILIESPLEEIDADVALMKEIMRRASRVVLNPTEDGELALRTDATIIRYPDRYTDARGDKIWAHVMGLLEQHEKRQAQEATAWA